MFKGNYKFKILLGLLALALGFFLLPFLASAQSSLGIEWGTDTGLGTRDLKELIVTIVRIFLGFLGLKLK